MQQFVTNVGFLITIKSIAYDSRLLTWDERRGSSILSSFSASADSRCCWLCPLENSSASWLLMLLYCGQTLRMYMSTMMKKICLCYVTCLTAADHMLTNNKRLHSYTCLPSPQPSQMTNLINVLWLLLQLQFRTNFIRIFSLKGRKQSNYTESKHC